MNIGDVGYNFTNSKFVDFSSNTTLLENDALIIDLNFIASNLINNFNNYAFYEKRRKDAEEFLRFKDVPIIFFAPAPQTIHLNRNRLVETVGFDFFMPIPEVRLMHESGKIIEVEPKTLFTDFLDKFKDYFYYESYFTSGFGTTIAVTPHTKKVLGFYTDECIFLPKVKKMDSEKEASFLKELIAVARKVKKSNTPLPLPDWAFKFFLPNESELYNTIKETEEQIRALRNKLVQLKNESQKFILKKRLFTASGNDLENEVESVFNELGVEILEADKNRDDLIIRFNDKVAVVEIKGVNSSAAEKHAAQLEKWTANYFEKTGTSPKGILIVNTFREIELNSRNEQSFPDQMLRYSTQREHCLITSVQLMGLYYEAKANPDKREELIDSLFSTIGIYPGFLEWKEYISQA